MPIELICVTCRKRLRVPDAAAGRNARCPACGATVKVPAKPRTPIQMDPAAAVAEPEPWFDEGGWAPAGPVTFGTIWQHAVAAWKKDIGGLAAALLLVVIVAAPIQGGIAAGQYFGIAAVKDYAKGRRNAETTATIGTVGIGTVGGILSFVVSSATGAAMLFIFVDAARGKPVSQKRLLDARHCILPYIGMSIWYTVVTALGLALLIVPGILYALSRWPAMFFIIDKNQGIFDSLASAKRATKDNWMTSFVVLLVSGALCLAGVLLVLGIFVLGPLSGVLMASAYLHMTGQLKANQKLDPYAERARIAKEKKEAAAAPPPEDNLPDFA